MPRSPRPNAEQRLAASWKAVWETPTGRLAISELMVATNVYSEITVTDPVHLALAVGERNVGARIARLIGLKAQNYTRDAAEAVDLLERFMTSSETTY